MKLRMWVRHNEVAGQRIWPVIPPRGAVQRRHFVGSGLDDCGVRISISSSSSSSSSALFSIPHKCLLPIILLRLFFLFFTSSIGLPLHLLFIIPSSSSIPPFFIRLFFLLFPSSSSPSSLTPASIPFSSLHLHHHHVIAFLILRLFLLFLILLCICVHQIDANSPLPAKIKRGRRMGGGQFPPINTYVWPPPPNGRMIMLPICHPISPLPLFPSSPWLALPFVSHRPQNRRRPLANSAYFPIRPNPFPSSSLPFPVHPSFSLPSPSSIPLAYSSSIPSRLPPSIPLPPPLPTSSFFLPSLLPIPLPSLPASPLPSSSIPLPPPLPTSSFFLSSSYSSFLPLFIPHSIPSSIPCSPPLPLASFFLSSSYSPFLPPFHPLFLLLFPLPSPLHPPFHPLPLPFQSLFPSPPSCLLFLFPTQLLISSSRRHQRCRVAGQFAGFRPPAH